MTTNNKGENTMKKTTTFALAVFATLALSACGNTTEEVVVTENGIPCTVTTTVEQEGIFTVERTVKNCWTYTE